MIAAIVLAAGLGRRLAGVTALPKWLLPVRDHAPACPAQAQLDALGRLGVERCHVVVGDDVGPIESAIERWATTTVELVVNEESETRNNWYSLLLGLERTMREGADEIVLLNSDLYAGAGWLADVLARSLDADAPAALVVDPERGRTEEAMKVSAAAGGGLILRIGKVGVDDPAGEYIGAARWSAPAAAELAGILRGFVDDGDRVDHWYEHGIDDHLVAGSAYAMVPTPDSRWVEIDDVNDLESARELSLGPPH